MREVLTYCKETDNKYRWDTDVDGVRFKIYIPKWRVPKPRPEKISVQIFEPSEYGSQIHSLTPKDAETDPTLVRRRIVTEVAFLSEMTETAKYKPVGDRSDWEIGNPYIPLSLLDDTPAETLIVTIDWID